MFPDALSVVQSCFRGHTCDSSSVTTNELQPFFFVAPGLTERISAVAAGGEGGGLEVN